MAHTNILVTTPVCVYPCARPKMEIIEECSIEEVRIVKKNGLMKLSSSYR